MRLTTYLTLMTKIIQKYKYQQLARDETSGVRLYVCPDGNKVPSVTTILSATKSKDKQEILDNWRRSVGTQKADQICFEASSRGTRIHKYMEDYINGKPLPDKVSNPFANQSLIMATTIINNISNSITEFYGSEVSLYYPSLYAGTTDAIGLHNNDLAIFDFKQSNKPKTRDMIEDYFYQLSSYILCHDYLYGTKITKGVILMCTVDLEYLEFILEGTELEYYKDKWWDKVEKYHLG